MIKQLYINLSFIHMKTLNQYHTNSNNFNIQNPLETFFILGLENKRQNINNKRIFEFVLKNS